MNPEQIWQHINYAKRQTLDLQSEQQDIDFQRQRLNQREDFIKEQSALWHERLSELHRQLGTLGLENVIPFPSQREDDGYFSSPVL